MSASMEVMPPGGHETYATSIFSKIKMYLDSNPYGYVSKAGDTMTGNLTAPKFIGALQGNASTASKLGSSNVGSANQPIYLNGGTATACTYTLGKSVPSNAVFTDHYAWTDITGKPSTFTPSTHYHYELKTIGDRRTISTTPNTYVDKLIFQGLKAQSYIGNPGGTSGYSYLLGLRGWGDSSGGDAHELAFNNNGIYCRHGSTTTWGNWSKIFTSTGGTVSGATTFSASGIAVTVNADFYCKSKVRTTYVCRPDDSDSGYVNHVNTSNNAYRPIRASAFTNMSCKYTKENIVDISEEDALKLLDIRPVNFDYVEEVGGQKDQIGVLAEDTYEVLPKVVSVPDDYVEEDFDISKGIHQPLPSVDYAKFVPYLIKLVQMQQKEIDILKKERT